MTLVCRRTPIITLIFAMLLASWTANAAVPKAAAVAAAQKLSAEARTAYMARDYDKAVILYAEALKNFDHENLWFTYGRSLEQTAQFKVAAQAFERAVALMSASSIREVAVGRQAANVKLDEAQQLLNDGQAPQAQPLARAAHDLLFAQSRRAADGQVYPEPASVLLLLARLEMATGNAVAAQQALAEIKADPTAPAKVVERATQLADASAIGETSPSADRPAAGLRARPPAGPIAEQKPIVGANVHPQQPLARWIALGGSGAVALAGVVLLAVSASEKSGIQSKIDTATASGKPVDGMSLTDYVDAKSRLDRNYFAGSAMAIAGGVGVAASALWMLLAPNAKVVVAPQVGGATLVVAW